MATRRIGPWIAGLAGLAGLALLVRHLDGPALLAALRASGWAVVGVTSARAITMVFATLGWWRLLPDGVPRLRVVAPVRLAREGVNLLLPFTSLGGDVLGARLLAKRGAPGAVAAAATLADVFIQSLAQLPFTLVGIALLGLGGHRALALWTLPGVALLIAALCAFVWLQRFGASRWLDRAAASAAARWPDLVDPTRFDLRAQIKAVYARPGVLGASFGLHLIGWMFDAAAPWVVLHARGYAPTLAEAVVIESLAQAIRGAAFFIPGGIGVQEGGLVFLCALYGVPPEAALTLSLVKRAADLAIGLPGLVAWWRIELATARVIVRPSARTFSDA